MRGQFLGALGVLLWTAMFMQAQSSNQPNVGDAQSLTSSPATVPATTAAPSPGPDSKTLELVKQVRAVYPNEAVANQMQGEVKLKLLVNESGDVEDAQVIDGDDVFRKSAVDAVKKWKFKPFIKNGKAIKVATIINMDFAISGHTKDVKDPDSGKSTEAPAPVGTSAPVAGLPVRVRISQGVSEGLLLHKVQPTYPPAARMNHIEGSVVLRAVIGKNGEIQDLKVVSGPPELVQSAMGAVRQWRYKPYYLKGEPVEVDTQITVNYVLRPF